MLRIRLSILLLGLLILLTGCATKTALMRAVEEGNVAALEALLSKDAKVNARDKHGETALMYAAHDGHIEIVRRLLSNGADVNVRSYNGSTALMQAAGEGHIEVVGILLANGADINANNDVRKWVKMDWNYRVLGETLHGGTALMRAVYMGHIEVVRVLLGHDADVNARDKNGNTSLICAVISGQTEAARVLLAHGADFDAATIEYAEKQGLNEVAHLLREAEAKKRKKE